MIIETALLSEDAKSFRGEDHSSILELEDDMFFRANDRDPVFYDFQARLASSDLIVSGTLNVLLSGRCARCNEWASLRVKVPGFLKVRKLSAKNEIVDLTADMREDILLAFPLVFICSESCAGLCPRCGSNLNKGKCSCERRDVTGGWNSLSRLNAGT